MTRHLCISVTLIDSLFHGQRDSDEPEWPPSPMRFFQALLAGSRTGWRNGRWSDDDEHSLRAAFEWLERRDPPEIVAPEARPAAAYTLFVPNNDSDKEFDRQNRLTSKVVRPHRLVGGATEDSHHSTLHYIWRIADEEWPVAESHVKVLCHEARHLIALGWGIDQAVGDGKILTTAQASALAGVRWRAWRGPFSGQLRLRVPKEGLLKDLEVAHDSFLERVRAAQRGQSALFEYTSVQKPRRFDAVVYIRVGQFPPRPYAVFELPEGVGFRQESTIEVAAMLRSLVCDERRYRNRHDFGEQFPELDPEIYLAGHTIEDPSLRNGPTPPRFSYLPLPTIGHEHADGMIRRLLIAEPFGGNGARALWAQQRLGGQSLRDKEGHDRGVLLDLWRKSSPAMVERYVGESRTWATVTPVILPGFDDAGRWKGIPADRRDRPTKAERLFLKAVAQAGLPLEAVSDITLRKAPFWRGSQHPNVYRRPDYLDAARGRRFSAWHVHLLFRGHVRGPLSLGAGRHCGLGLFAAWST